MKLEDDLHQLDKVHMASARRDALKNRIMMRVSADTLLMREMRAVGAATVLPLHRRVVLKERIISALSPLRVFGMQRWGFRTFGAVMMALLFVFSLMGSLFFIEPAQVYAESVTILDSFAGEVVVKRNGSLVQPSVGMELYEYDMVVTGEAGSATIVYFDDSVSRLSHDTEVELSQLSFSDDSHVVSQVEVTLKKGMLWSKVVNLVDEASRFVVKTVRVSAASQRAAFNVAVQGDAVEIGVFDHSVRVYGEAHSNEVRRGQKALIDEGVVLGEIADYEKEAAWVTDNLASDEHYVAAVEEKKRLAKIEQVDKVLRTEMLSLLTFDDIKKKRIALDLAEKELLASEVALEGPRVTETMRKEFKRALAAFYTQVEEFYALIGKVAAQDPKYAQDLRDYALEKLLVHKKDLSLTLPSSPLYEVKEKVDELVLLEKGDAERVLLRYKQAQSELAEAVAHFAKGDTKLGMQFADKYKERLHALQAEIASLDEKVRGQIESEIARDYAQLVALELEVLNEITALQRELTPQVGVASSVSGEVVVPVVSEPAPLPLPEPPAPYGVEVVDEKPLPPGL